jgi:hypothetical protein
MPEVDELEVQAALRERGVVLPVVVRARDDGP